MCCGLWFAKLRHKDGLSQEFAKFVAEDKFELAPCGKGADVRIWLIRDLSDEALIRRLVGGSRAFAD